MSGAIYIHSPHALIACRLTASILPYQTSCGFSAYVCASQQQRPQAERVTSIVFWMNGIWAGYLYRVFS
jgi:hypothetical protein